MTVSSSADRPACFGLKPLFADPGVFLPFEGAVEFNFVRELHKSVRMCYTNLVCVYEFVPFRNTGRVARTFSLKKGELNRYFLHQFWNR